MKMMKGLLFVLLCSIAMQTWSGSCPVVRHENDVFDFYLLSLSWSPEWCIVYGGKAPQCKEKRQFVLHGLWPQYKKGRSPVCCQNVDKPLDDALVKQLVPDVMPSQKLMQHQWEKHGTCARSTDEAYFALSKTLYEQFKYPKVFEEHKTEFPISRYKLRELIVEANQHIQLKDEMFVLKCDVAKHRNKAHRKTLNEIRVCIDKQGKPMVCPEGYKDACISQVIVRYGK